MKKPILFFDFEVRRFDIILVLIFENSEKKVIHLSEGSNSPINQLKKLVAMYTWVGYNNFFYDDKILTILLRYLSSKKVTDSLLKKVKQTNDLIINSTWEQSWKIERATTIDSVDVFQEIDVSKPSLKKIQFNLGMNIHESSVPFDLNRPMNSDEIADEVAYCTSDVMTTKQLYEMRRSYFETRNLLISMFDSSVFKKMPNLKTWNTTTLINHLFGQTHKPPTLKIENKNLLPEELKNIWDNLNADNLENITYNYNNFDVDFVFGLGGLHGVSRIKRATDVYWVDVNSMYPNILINLKLLKSNQHTKYLELMETKKTLDKKEVLTPEEKSEKDTVKLILNSFIGLFNNRFAKKLYSPMMNFSVTINGQILLYNLCQKLYETGAKLINVNTDGIAFTSNNIEEVEEVVAHWSKANKLPVKFDKFKKWIQKDVNNYVALTQNDEVVVKGADVNNYHKNHPFKTGKTPTIVDKCLVDKLLFDKNIQENLIENQHDLLRFQIPLIITKKFLGIYEKETGTTLKQRVNRAFATFGGNHYAKIKEIVKQKTQPDLKVLHSFPNLNIPLTVSRETNGSISEIKGLELNLEVYNKLINYKLKLWK